MAVILESTKDPKIKRNTETGIYFAKFMLSGIQVNKSLKTSSFEAAKRIVQQIENSILLGKPNLDDKETVESLWNTFLEDKKTGKFTKDHQPLRPKTLREYEDLWKNHLKEYWGHKTLDQINFDSWAKYNELVVKNKKISTYNLAKVFGAFCNWCHFKGYMPSKTKLIYLRNDESVAKVYDDDEIRDLIENAEMPLKLIVAMGFFMAMRKSEITQLTKDRIDLRKNVIILRKQDTKTKKARRVPIHPEVKPLIEEQLSHGYKPLFPHPNDKKLPIYVDGIERDWEALKLKTRIEGRFHDLRHSFCTRVFKRADINPLLICDMIGMDIKVAQKTYIHFDDNDRAVAMNVISQNFITEKSLISH